MRAITYSRFGPAADVLKLTGMPTPDPGPGEVLVEMAYSGVNPSDVKARAGSRPGVTRPPYPLIIPHSDGSGRIVAVGEGVPEDRVGQRVWIWNGQWKRAYGTCATHICLPAAQAIPSPESVSDETGACLGIPGLTATAAVFCNGGVSGKTVLVQGAAGSVGYLALQLAVWGGARVIATGRPDDHDRLRAAGADATIDYRDGDTHAAILKANDGRPVDHIVEVEFGLNAETDTQVIAENGCIAAYGSAQAMAPSIPFYQMMFKAVIIRTLLIYILSEADRARYVQLLHEALRADALSVPIDAVYSLARTVTAQEDVETGRRTGATLIACQD